MIIFHKHSNNCIACYETETALKDLVAAHSTNLLESELHIPIIIEGKKKFSGHKAIKEYISDLEKTMELWRKFQSDSCYIDSDGRIC
jgi:hypothetical protein